MEEKKIRTVRTANLNLDRHFNRYATVWELWGITSISLS